MKKQESEKPAIKDAAHELSALLLRSVGAVEIGSASRH
jgi:hypothetical protein